MRKMDGKYLSHFTPQQSYDFQSIRVYLKVILRKYKKFQRIKIYSQSALTPIFTVESPFLSFSLVASTLISCLPSVILIVSLISSRSPSRLLTSFPSMNIFTFLTFEFEVSRATIFTSFDSTLDLSDGSFILTTISS